MEKDKYQRLREDVLNLNNLEDNKVNDLLIKIRQEYNFDLNTLQIMSYIKENEKQEDFQKVLIEEVGKKENQKLQNLIIKVIDEKLQGNEGELINKKNTEKLINEKDYRNVMALRGEYSKTQKGFEIINLVDNLRFLKEQSQIKKMHSKDRGNMKNSILSVSWDSRNQVCEGKAEDMAILYDEIDNRVELPQIFLELKEPELVGKAKIVFVPDIEEVVEIRGVIKKLVEKSNLLLDFKLLKEMERKEDKLNYSNYENNYEVANKLNMNVSQFLHNLHLAALDITERQELKNKIKEFEYIKSGDKRKEIVHFFMERDKFDDIENEREELEEFYKEKVNKFEKISEYDICRSIGMDFNSRESILKDGKLDYNNMNELNIEEVKFKILKNINFDKVCKIYDNSEELDCIIDEFLEQKITIKEINDKLFDYQIELLDNYKLTRDTKLYVEAAKELDLLGKYPMEEEYVLTYKSIDKFHDQTLSACISECPGIEYEEIKNIEKDMKNLKDLYQDLRNKVITKEDIKYPRKNLVNELIEAQKVIDKIDILGEFKNEDNIVTKNKRKEEEYER